MVTFIANSDLLVDVAIASNLFGRNNCCKTMLNEEPSSNFSCI